MSLVYGMGIMPREMMMFNSIEDDEIAIKMFTTLAKLGFCQLIIIDRMFMSYGDPPFEVFEV